MQDSLKVKNTNQWPGFVILITSFLFGLRDELEQFLKELNKIHPNLKFAHESSTEMISFLDLSVSLSNGKLYINVYIKATNT